jgi:hypothetical protein
VIKGSRRATPALAGAKLQIVKHPQCYSFKHSQHLACVAIDHGACRHVPARSWATGVPYRTAATGAPSNVNKASESRTRRRESL